MAKISSITHVQLLQCYNGYMVNNINISQIHVEYGLILGESEVSANLLNYVR